MLEYWLQNTAHQQPTTTTFGKFATRNLLAIRGFHPVTPWQRGPAVWADVRCSALIRAHASHTTSVSYSPCLSTTIYCNFKSRRPLESQNKLHKEQLAMVIASYAHSRTTSTCPIHEDRSKNGSSQRHPTWQAGILNSTQEL